MSRYRVNNNKKGRGMTFKTRELEILLDLAEEKLPMGAGKMFMVYFTYILCIECMYTTEQEYLTKEYDERVAEDRLRDIDFLRTKCKPLKNKRKSTGDPDCRVEVKRAARIDRQSLFLKRLGLIILTTKRI